MAEQAKETAKKPEVKRVKIRLPLQRGEDPDVYVSINDESWLIKRGETVEVPEYVAELLDRAQAQRDRNLMEHEAHKI